MARELEEWGGEVRLPPWLRRVFRRPVPPENTPERAHEARQAQPTRTVFENANRGAVGSLPDLYAEGRKKTKR